MRDPAARLETLLRRGTVAIGRITGRRGAADQAALDTGRLAARADAARAVRDYSLAAALYDAAVEIDPTHVGIRIQCAHMFKETGELARAERHYLEAARQAPDNLDAALQLAHFYKRAGRPAEAQAAFVRVLELKPGWAPAVGELEALRTRSGQPLAAAPEGQDSGLDLSRLAPELFPRPVEALRHTQADGIQIKRLGARREPTRWGELPVLRGVEAVRGFCISRAPVGRLSITLDEVPLYEGEVSGRRLDGDVESLWKAVFNVWLNVASLPEGLHQITVQFDAAKGERYVHREHVVLAPAMREADYPDCDGVVDSAADTPAAVAAEVNARPSVVRPAVRSVFPTPPRSVLILRTDQLGDLVTSIPALERLRELLPGARLVGLLTAANVDVAHALGLFDEIIVADFPDDPVERRRIMTPAAQEALRVQLEAYAFDLAIDLAPSAVSRPLLRLTGARLLFGFDDQAWPWLDGGFQGTTHDPRNRQEIAAQSTKILALIERVGALLGGRAEVRRRPELSRGRLTPFGLEEADRFVVMHTGARIAFSRWPHYTALAALVLKKTDLKVVIVTDDPELGPSLPGELSGHDRFLLLDRRLPFDDFDALLSFCTVFVGNDSGPKHLASLRGSPVVSLHSSRINWNEWGQELTGLIVSRKVPCAGCAIFHDDDECGMDFACIRRITPEEVLAEMQRFL